MRLINTETGEFEDFIDSSKAPLYAILSHTWAQPPEKEQSYQDVVRIQERCGISKSSSPLKEPVPGCSSSSTGSTILQSTPNHLPRLPGARRWISRSGPSSARKRSIWDPKSGLSEKIQKACEVARQDGYRYIWIDSSCIDKTSSSELSEAINSMFSWYRDAQICYAFLSDVPSNDNVRREGRDRPSYVYMPEIHEDSKFRQSRWFKRAWTLQELIAPRAVVFLSQDWQGLGTKHSLADLIEEITHINRDILTHKKAVADESVAERMRWAASREATRLEDEAYSLLGIFGITMTTIYGEGQNAFQRLQEEILQRIPDRSLFAWCNSMGERPIRVSPENIFPKMLLSQPPMSPFASSPQWFANGGGKINKLSERDFEMLELPVEEYSPTPHGIRARIRLIPMDSLAPNFRVDCASDDKNLSIESWHLIILGSQHASYSGETTNYLLGKLCCLTIAKSSIRLLQVPNTRRFNHTHLIWIDFGLDIRSAIDDSIDVYLPRPTPTISKRTPAGDQPNESPSTTVSFSRWASHTMPPGYTIRASNLHPNEGYSLQPHNSPSFSILLSDRKSVNLLIQYRHISYLIKPDRLLSSYDEGLTVDFGVFIEARIWILSANSTTLDGSPPYASAVWGADENQSTLPIWHIPVPVTPRSGEFTWIALRLWLGIAKYDHYHAHVEVIQHYPVEVAEDVHHHAYVEAMAAAPSPQHTHAQVAIGNASGKYCPRSTARRFRVSRYSSIPLHTPEPLPHIKFTMLGSAKMALEAQQYSVHFEVSDRSSRNSHPHSHSLIISDSAVRPTFAISIKYFHNRSTCPGEKFPQFLFAARVTLESSPGYGSEGYQDGPYVLNWADNYQWSWESAPHSVYLTTPSGEALALELDLDRAWVLEYYLIVNLSRNRDSHSQTGASNHLYRKPKLRLVDPHDHIDLSTLPIQTRRALQTQGYEVHFEGTNDSAYRLILSDADLTISIKYSHLMSTGINGQQALTFQACITTSLPKSSQDAVTQPGYQTVNWDAWQTNVYDRFGDVEKREGWRWELPDEDIVLSLSNGLD